MKFVLFYKKTPLLFFICLSGQRENVEREHSTGAVYKRIDFVGECVSAGQGENGKRA